MAEKKSHLTVSRRVMREWTSFRNLNNYAPELGQVALWAMTRMEWKERDAWISHYRAWCDWVPSSTDAAAEEGRKS